MIFLLFLFSKRKRLHLETYCPSLCLSVAYSVVKDIEIVVKRWCDADMTFRRSTWKNRSLLTFVAVTCR